MPLPFSLPVIGDDTPSETPPEGSVGSYIPALASMLKAVGAQQPTLADTVTARSNPFSLFSPQNLRETLAAARDPQTWTDAAKQYALGLGTEAPRGIRGALPRTAYMPHEEVPGKVTGLYDALKPELHGDFTAQANWRDPVTQRDRLTGNILPQSSTLPMHGTYENSEGQFETNPGFVVRPTMPPIKRGGELPTDVSQTLQTASTVRGTMGMQEITPWHYIDTRKQPLSDMDSLRLTGVDPTRAQMNQIAAIAKDHGFYPAHTGDGISLVNAEEPDGLGGRYGSPQDGAALLDRLNGGMADELRQALPGVRIAQGRSIKGGAFLTDALDKVRAGQGAATKEMVQQLEALQREAPDKYAKLVNEQGVADYARDKLKALQRTGLSDVRPDFVNLLKIVRNGRLQGVLDRVRGPLGYGGLPAALATIAAGRDAGREK